MDRIVKLETILTSSMKNLHLLQGLYDSDSKDADTNYDAFAAKNSHLNRHEGNVKRTSSKTNKANHMDM